MRITRECVFCQSTDLDYTPAILMPFVAHRALGWVPTEITSEWKLRDIPSGHAHAACQTVRCHHCHGLFMDLRFGDAEMQRLYQDYRGSDYVQLRSHYEAGYAERQAILVSGSPALRMESFIRPFVPAQPRVLDWGGGDGANTPFAQTARFCHVYDIAGKTLRPGIKAVDKNTMTAHHYDLIVMSHVLEHLPEPVVALKEVAAVMTAETQLYIEVPFEPLMRQHEQAIAKGEPCPPKHHWHEHINFFSRAALSQLCQHAGLTLRQISTYPEAANQGQCLIALCSK